MTADEPTTARDEGRETVIGVIAGQVVVQDDQCPMTGRRCDRPCGGACIRGLDDGPAVEADNAGEERQPYPCYCLPGPARCDDPYAWCDRPAPAAEDEVSLTYAEATGSQIHHAQAGALSELAERLRAAGHEQAAELADREAAGYSTWALNPLAPAPDEPMPTEERRAEIRRRRSTLIDTLARRDMFLAFDGPLPRRPAVSPGGQADEGAEELARRFHEAYERLAPDFGYETRRESAVPWDQVPEQNRALMTAVCAEVVAPLLADRQAAQRVRALADEIERPGSEAARYLADRIRRALDGGS